MDPGRLPQGITVVEASRQVRGFALPVAWFPYVKAGQSPTGMACDLTGGKFGPFPNQMFVGEFVLSGVNRVFIEKVGGEYQGVVFRFLDGLQSAALSLAFLRDGSLLVGESNRGWNSQGTRSFGLERVRWTGRVPFEIECMEVQPDGFLLTFTKPVDAHVAGAIGGYSMTGYTYLYHQKYGSDEVDAKSVPVTRVSVAEDGRTVRLWCEGMRPGYVHELQVRGVKSAEGEELCHAEAFYTLNRLGQAD